MTSNNPSDEQSAAPPASPVSAPVESSASSEYSDDAIQQQTTTQTSPGTITTTTQATESTSQSVQSGPAARSASSGSSPPSLSEKAATMPRTKTSPLAAHYDSLHSSEDSSPAKSNKLELMTPGVAITTATPVALPVHGQQQTSTSSDDTVLRTDEVGLSDSIVPQVSLQPWRIPFFDCFSPLDNRLISWCVPCINYGKTDHRMNVDTSMENYGPINGPCLLTAALYWFCPACLLVPFCMQRQEVREQYGLEGGDCTDCLAACFCTCCSVAQVEKEAKAREEERIANARGQGQYPQM